MIIDPHQFDELAYLADQLEEADHFEMNLKSFIRLTEQLKKRLYHYIDNPDVLDTIDGLPVIEFQAYRRSFLEQMLPKARREMVGKYKNREEIRVKVRQTMDTLNRIRRWLGEDDGLV